MLEGSVDQYSIPQQENQTSAISMIAGTGVLALLLPTAAIALLELLDQIEYGEFRWIISSILFSLTIVSILLISGLNLVGFLKSDNLKMVAGIYLIFLSMLNLLMRMSNINYDREMWYVMPWFDFIQLPMAHERLELAFLGIIIGALIMKK
ncbi:MAG: hypothetical protein Ct9H90mP14_0070 [Methanobacteriota archaeon]|jgi:hypothetical protein|nr:MAG: hypothetical protein Ct9H90mP14_0070 [Euryarchaeota archaeon]|tara:strand:+ start:1053 stop:1505 length:453 start_codon:yes stop_codon:yes gene_type:complete